MEKLHWNDRSSPWTGRPYKGDNLVSHWGGVPMVSLGEIFLGCHSDYSLTFDKGSAFFAYETPRAGSTYQLLASSSTPSFPSIHKFTSANLPLRMAEKEREGSYAWKEDCFVVYLHQNVRKSKLLTIINNWGGGTQNSHKMTQKDGMCEDQLLFALLVVCNTVHSKTWSFRSGSGYFDSIYVTNQDPSLKCKP